MKSSILKVALYFIFTLGTISLFTACEDDSEEILEVSASTLLVEADGNNSVFSIISSGEWSITSDEEWCKVTPTQGSGNADVRVRGTVAETSERRSAELVIRSGQLTKTVEVIQKGLSLTLNKTELTFPAEGGAQTIELKSENQEWSILPVSDEYLSVLPMSGTGSAEIAFTLKPNSVSREKSIRVTLQYGSQKQTITIKQGAGPNNAPIAPVLNSPSDNQNDVFVAPDFSWQVSTDPDGDNLRYVLMYSKDQQDWSSSETTTDIRFSLTYPLDGNTRYFWKIKVSDGKGGVTESETRSFQTADINLPADGSYVQFEGDDLTGTIPVVFMGDGFSARDYESGLFDRKVDEGIAHFFSVEPYISYRNNFKAYKMVVYSRESGASRWNENANNYLYKKETAFDTRYYGDGYSATFMTTNCDKVYNYAQTISDVDAKVLDRTTVVLIVNDPIYSGTCWMSTSGRSVAIVPTCDQNQPFSYQETMIHEAGGHGFGRLADEYLFSNQPIDENAKNNILFWSNLGANANIDVVYKKDEIKWRHFFTEPGYEMVGVYSGAQYSSGVWMPETASAMRDMRMKYYNAPSREAIVKRIKQNLNETYSFEGFVRKDRVNGYNGTGRSIRNLEKGFLPSSHTSPQVWHSNK